MHLFRVLYIFNRIYLYNNGGSKLLTCEAPPCSYMYMWLRSPISTSAPRPQQWASTVTRTQHVFQRHGYKLINNYSKIIVQLHEAARRIVCNSTRRIVRSSTQSTVRNFIRCIVHSFIRCIVHNLNDALYVSLHNALYAALHDELYATLHDALSAAVHDALYAALHDAL